MYFLLAEIIQPINCVLVSENVPSISIVLSERRSNDLKGVLTIENNVKGNFYTYKPTKEEPSSWGFEKPNIKFNGEKKYFYISSSWKKNIFFTNYSI